MTKLISLVIILISIASASAQTVDSFERSEIRDVLANYDRAWNAKDVKTITDMLDERYVYFSSVGSLSDKKSTLEFLAKPDYKLTFVERSEHKLHSSDGRVAIVSSRWKGKGSWSGGEINDDQRCGQVFVKSGRNWKLASEHCVQIEKK